MTTKKCGPTIWRRPKRSNLSSMGSNRSFSIFFGCFLHLNFTIMSPNTSQTAVFACSTNFLSIFKELNISFVFRCNSGSNFIISFAEYIIVKK